MLTNKQRLILWGSLAIIIIIIAFGAFFWRQDQLAYRPVELVLEEEEAWHDLDIDNYIITVEEADMPFRLLQFTVHVENGAIASAVCVDALYGEDCEIDDYEIENYTLHGLFVNAAKLARRHGGATQFNIVFDVEYHYPQRFGIYTKDLPDSDQSWTVISFEIVDDAKTGED